MDIYQIWTTYNKQWSRYEILAFVGVLIEIIPKLKKIYIINFFICLLEFGLGYSGDNIGGIFGTQSGCNGYLNLFLIKYR